MTKLQERWLDLWKRLGAHGDPEPAYAELRRRYSEPHRAYHTLDHIRECLEEFDAAWGLARDPVAVLAAIWYHDAIYDTQATDNEERSAKLAREAAAAAGRPEEFQDRVEALILASRHRGSPAPGDAQLFVDIDLSILGQRRERFDRYEEQIRYEYAWVPGPIFRSKRRAILQSFLDRPLLYSTPFFQNRYEARARENLKRSLGLRT